MLVIELYKADDILKTVTKINKTNTTGLDKLSTIEEEKKESKDGDEDITEESIKEIK